MPRVSLSAFDEFNVWAVDEYGLIVADGHHVVVAVAVEHNFGRGFAEDWAVDVGHDAEVHESQARVVAVEVGGRGLRCPCV